jgi:branched-chain amino acid transport system ATP-binding protein
MLLEVRDLRARYGDLQALHGIDLALERGRTLAIVGANGAGKSTLLRCLCGQHTSRSGSIRFDGHAVDALPAHALARLGISMVPEGRRLFASLSVEENILLGTNARRTGTWTLERVYALFPKLVERRHLPSRRLSGGEQQMVAIARALLANPRLLICDELSLGLAPVVISELYEHLAQVRSAGASLLIVEQDVSRALAASDELLCLTEGRVTLRGDPAQLTRPQIAAAYFGARRA